MADLFLLCWFVFGSLQQKTKDKVRKCVRVYICVWCVWVGVHVCACTCVHVCGEGVCVN